MDQSIIDKIAKLLNTQGRTPEEAAAYVAKAQDLMREHDLTMESVSAHVDKRTGAGIGIERQERVVLRKKGKPGSWKIDLFASVAASSDCWSFVSDGNGWWDATGYMVGRKQDIEMAMYTYSYLVNELERQQNVYGRERWDELKDYARREGMSTHEAERIYSDLGNHPLRSKESWIKGATISVVQALRDAKLARDSRTENDKALMVNKRAEKEDWSAQQRGFKDAADEKAKRALARANMPAVVEKPMTAKERRHWEAMDRKAQRAADAAYRREAAKLDYSAYRRGLEDGRKITLRPGVKGGE